MQRNFWRFMTGRCTIKMKRATKSRPCFPIEKYKNEKGEKAMSTPDRVKIRRLVKQIGKFVYCCGMSALSLPEPANNTLPIGCSLSDPPRAYTVSGVTHSRRKFLPFHRSAGSRNHVGMEPKQEPHSERGDEGSPARATCQKLLVKTTSC